MPLRRNNTISEYIIALYYTIVQYKGFSPTSVGKESSCNAGDPDSIPGSRRSPGEENGNPLQCSCLENPMNKRGWRATVHGVARGRHNLATKPPPYYTILYYIILYYSILYYIILYYTILFYTILYYSILYYTILYYILYYTRT